MLPESPVPFSQAAEVDAVINITEPLNRCQQEGSDTLQLLILPTSMLENDSWEGKVPLHRPSLCVKSSPAPHGSPATLEPLIPHAIKLQKLPIFPDGDN